MNILAFDSTAKTASVALARDGKILADFFVDSGKTHSEILLPMAEDVLARAHVQISEIDYFAVTAGPGSFTGVRIGVATIKGLAFGKNKPCVAVSTLEALAENLIPCEGILCPVMNARRGQVYNALFRYEDGKLIRLCEDRAISALDLETELLAKNEAVYFSGDGVGEIKRLCKQIEPGKVSEQLVDQNAVSVAKCARRTYSSGVHFTDAELSPVYLRLPQAERERLERQNQTKE